MKKIVSPLRCSYDQIYLCKNDVMEIGGVLKECGSPIRDINTDTYEYDNFDDFINNTDGLRLKELSIIVSTPRVLISVSRNMVSLYSSADDDKAIAVFYKIKGILDKSVPSMSWFFNWKFMFIVSILMWGITYFHEYIMSVRLFLCVGAFFAMFIIYYLTRMIIHYISGGVILIMADRGKRDSVWMRNKDQVFLSIVSSVLGFVFGVIGTLLVQYLSGK
jgi:hypothetical protein